MNTITTKQYVGLIVVALVAGLIGNALGHVVPQLSGDFAGGIQPNQVWIGNGTTNTVSPVGSFVVAANNGLTVGGTAAVNQVSLVGVGTSTFNALTFGSVGQTSSTATSSVTVNVGGFTVGDYCDMSLTTVPTSTAFTAKGFVSAANATTSIVLVSFGSGASANVTVATGTLHAECHHYAI